MGEPAHLDGWITFAGEVPEEFTTKEKLKAAIEKHYRATSKNTEAADITVDSVEVVGGCNGVEFTMSSGRHQNLAWQLEQLVELVRDKFPKDAVELSTSGHVQAADLCVCIDDFDDAVEE